MSVAVNSVTYITKPGKTTIELGRRRSSCFGVLIWGRKGGGVNGIVFEDVLVGRVSDSICQSIGVPEESSSKCLFKSKMRIPKRPVSISLCLSLFSPPPEKFFSSSSSYFSRILHFHSGFLASKISDHSANGRIFVCHRGSCFFLFLFPCMAHWLIENLLSWVILG